MKHSHSQRAIWEDEIYGQGKHLNRAPYDFVVSFIMRNAPKDKPRNTVRILEVGCGAGNNLFFAAQEGFQVAGIDISPSAVEFAQERFRDAGLEGDFRVGTFDDLPFEPSSFDLVIDRGAITCVSPLMAARTIQGIHHVLQPKGKFILNAYSDVHTSCITGKLQPDGLTTEISSGLLTGVGPLCFYGRQQVLSLFSGGWKLLSVQHVQLIEQLEPNSAVHAEWRVSAEKIGR